MEKSLLETKKAITNLLRAIEACIFNESTKERMNELDQQKSELKLALAAAKRKEDLGLKKEHIVFFLHQFANMDCTDVACQKRLIKTFLNSVFVYDDKVVLTFNYSGDDRTMTLHEIDGGLGHSIRIPHSVVHQKNTDAYASVFFIAVEVSLFIAFIASPAKGAASPVRQAFSYLNVNPSRNACPTFSPSTR